MRTWRCSRVPRCGAVLFLAAALSLVASLAPFGRGVVLAAYTYSCDGYSRHVHAYVSQDVTEQTYWINEVVSYATVIHLYPCQSTGTGSGQFDAPAILGANLQYYDTPQGGYIVQLAFQRCDQDCPSGWPEGKEVLAWTYADNTGGAVQPATWWNQGLGASILQEGDEYETAILPSGTQWAYAVRDLTTGGAFTYHYATNHWPVHSGGNYAWWGSEVGNWQSVMGHRAPDPAFNMNTMEWKESDNGAWHHMYPSDCVMDNGPSYYDCWIYDTNVLDSWTNDH